MKLGEHINILSGYAFDSNLFNDKNEGIPIIRIRDIGKNKVSTYYKGDYNKDFLINRGDFLVGMDGDFRLAKWQCEEALLNQRVCKIEVKSQSLNPDYLFYFLPQELKKIEDSTSFATVKHLSVKKIQEIQIPLPPLEQQKKIAAILDAADAYRQKTKALIAKYDELTQSLFLDMFGDPVKNEKGWEILPFGNFITVLTDYHSNGSYESLRDVVTLKNEPDYALMVRTTDLENNNFEKDVIYIDEKAYNHLEKSKVFGGEIIINKIGSAGKVYRMPHLNRPVSLGMNAFLLRFNELVNDTFLYFQLVSSQGEREIQKRVKGAVTKTIRKDALREVPLLSPPIKLQNQFAERVQAIEEQKAQAQASLEKAEELFNSLLQRAFKGELA
jgi:type I restriction enzyme S subunit